MIDSPEKTQDRIMADTMNAMGKIIDPTPDPEKKVQQDILSCPDEVAESLKELHEEVDDLLREGDLYFREQEAVERIKMHLNNLPAILKGYDYKEESE